MGFYGHIVLTPHQRAAMAWWQRLVECFQGRLEYVQEGTITP